MTAPREPGEDEYSSLGRLARAHLEPGIAERWLRLLRPAIRLSAADEHEEVVAQLGGRPSVPPGFDWPMWEGHGPLSFVAEIDLTALDRMKLDASVPIPTEGRLLAFYFDGSYDDFEGLVGTWDKESLAGARLLHVSQSRSECEERAAPDGVVEFEAQALGARQILTFPDWEHPVLEGEFRSLGQGDRDWLDHPVNADPFMESLGGLHDEPRHQIGGWAAPVQGPVEFEVAEAALDAPYGDDAHVAEALLWRLLLQIDSDDDSEMMWGDVGTLYWLTRSEAAFGETLGPISFTWQCS